MSGMPLADPRPLATALSEVEIGLHGALSALRLRGNTPRRPKLRWPLHVLLGGAKADGHRALVEPLLPAGVSGITPSTATMGTQ